MQHQVAQPGWPAAQSELSAQRGRYSLRSERQRGRQWPGGAVGGGGAEAGQPLELKAGAPLTRAVGSVKTSARTRSAL